MIQIIRIFAIILWVIAVLAVVDMTHGNPGAINGVIGASVCAVLMTMLAIAVSRMR